MYITSFYLRNLLPIRAERLFLIVRSLLVKVRKIKSRHMRHYKSMSNSGFTYVQKRKIKIYCLNTYAID